MAVVMLSRHKMNSIGSWLQFADIINSQNESDQCNWRDDGPESVLCVSRQWASAPYHYYFS